MLLFGIVLPNPFSGRKIKNMLFDVFNIRKGKTPPFIDEIAEKDNAHIVRLKGEIDMFSIPDIRQYAQTAQEKRGALQKNIIVDFEKVTHVDSATIAVLLRALFMVKHERHKFALINVTEELKDNLKIAKLEKAIPIYDSEESALKSFATKKQS